MYGHVVFLNYYIWWKRSFVILKSFKLTWYIYIIQRRQVTLLNGKLIPLNHTYPKHTDSSLMINYNDLHYIYISIWVRIFAITRPRFSKFILYFLQSFKNQYSSPRVELWHSIPDHLNLIFHVWGQGFEITKYGM